MPPGVGRLRLPGQGPYQGNQPVPPFAGRDSAAPAGCDANQKLRRHGRGEGNSVYRGAEVGRAAGLINTMLSRCMSSWSDMLPRISMIRLIGWRMIRRRSEEETSELRN